VKIEALLSKNEPYTGVFFEEREAKITEPGGRVVFEAKIKVPSFWSKTAVDIIAQKYFRKKGVPLETTRVAEENIPEYLQKSIPAEGTEFGSETLCTEAFNRLAGCWTYWGYKYGYFSSDEDAKNFYDECLYILCHQLASPNSPQWFNTGLNWAYGITGGPQGHYYVEQNDGTMQKSKSAYERPQPSACYILSVQDNLVNSGGLMDLWNREAMVFKYGSGVGSNFSKVRGKNEPLSGGGKSSGLMSFLRVGDRSAGAIKSGGVVRRAAKMVILDDNHPDIEEFINWKCGEEEKVASISVGSKVLEKCFLEIAGSVKENTEENWNPKKNKALKKVIKRYLDYGVPARYIQKAINLGKQTGKLDDVKTLGVEWESEAYETVSGQNANNSIRIKDDFIKAVKEEKDWNLYWRTELSKAKKEDRKPTPCRTLKAKDLWNSITKAAWNCADPGLQFHDTVNEWHTCPAGGEIVATNPCFAGDQRVLTHLGWIPLADLVKRYQNGEQILVATHNWTANDPEDSITFNEPLHVYVNDPKEIITLKFSDGSSLRATGNHRVWTRDGYKKVEDLVIGDTLPKMGRVYSKANYKSGATLNNSYYLRASRNPLNFNDINEIRETNWENQRAYLTGVFFSKGTLIEDQTTQKKELVLITNNERYLQDIQLILVTHGIISNISECNGDFALKINDGYVEALLKNIPCEIPLEDISIVSKKSGDVEVTYNLTEPTNHSYIVEGRPVSNCSEYMFLDDTSCNLASINLLRFLDPETRKFDVVKFRHVANIFAIMLELSVLLGHFPSEAVARNSFDYRTLGLGYANLGALLMTMGIPYDSKKGVNIAAAITAILQGQAAATSAILAKDVGTFLKYPQNKDSMEKVVYNHWAATQGPSVPFKDLSKDTQRIDPDECPEYLVQAAQEAMKEGLDLGKLYGYRNAQFTNLAPTGTIAFVMDCDTTGIEPDFAIVKHKTLAGGGTMKIVNRAVDQALKNLGYPEEQVNAIKTYCLGTGKLPETGILSRNDLKSSGFSEEEIFTLESSLLTAFHLSHVLTDNLRDYISKKGDYVDLTRKLNIQICGSLTLEGAPYIREEHLSIFDCATKCGEIGKRFILPMGHVRMMAAVQPFLSGAISKTINMPENCSINDVSEVYMRSFELGVKAIAIYRDNSKLSQPLNSSVEFGGDDEEKEPIQKLAGVRQELPTRRLGYTQKARIAGHTVYVHTGEYPNGALGEIFLGCSKSGAPFQGLLNSFAIAVSMGLQYGVPLDEFISAFVGTKFEPQGLVEGNPHIKMCTSFIDYIFRELAVTYNKRADLAHVTNSDMASDLVSEDVMASLRQRVAPLGSMDSKDESIKAKSKGYEGEPCIHCGNWTLSRSGTCLRCATCGSTTGCS
jgi:ribonucleotide reductase alpha subunit